MNSRFQLLAACIFLASCTATSLDVAQNEVENAVAQKAQVTVVNQVKEVNPMLASLVAQSNSAATSRSGYVPEIESVDVINDSKGNPAIYVVNNANNQGFTLVSATTDYTPILAMSDEGHFNWEDAKQCGASVVVGESLETIEHAAELPDSIRLKFNAAWEEYTATKKDYELPQSRSSEDVYNFIRYKVGQWESQGYTVYTVENYMSTSAYASLPADVRYQIQDLPYGYANPNYGGIYNVSFVLEKRPYSSNYVPALITTHWHQFAPYNNAINGNRVGCIPVAIGQVMNYHGYPAFTNDTTYLVQIRRLCGISDSSFDGGSNINRAKRAFEDMGYTHVTKINHNATLVSNDIQNSRPVVMKGYDPSFGEGHAWVADGLNESWQSLEIKLMCLEDCPFGYTPQNFENPYVYNHLDSHITYFHMNWGTRNSSAGYFIDGYTTLGQYNYYAEREDLINIYR